MKKITKAGEYELALDQITLNGGTQVREAIDEQQVGRLMEAYESGRLPKVPALLVYADGDNLWLVDGFHRHEALRRLGRVRVACEVRIGTHREAVLESKGVNAEHGLPRSRADKRRAVVSLLEDTEWNQWSDRALAKAARVSNTYVSALRQELATAAGVNADTSTTRKGLDGKTYEVPARPAKTEAPPAAPKLETRALIEAIEATEAELHRKPGEFVPWVLVVRALDYLLQANVSDDQYRAAEKAALELGLVCVDGGLQVARVVGAAPPPRARPAEPLDLEDEDDSAEADLEEDLGLEFIRLALEQLEDGAPGAPVRQETVADRALELADLDEVPEEAWQRALAEGQARKLWKLSGDVMRRVVEPPREPVPAMPPGVLEEPTPLPDDERAPLDAYWTPYEHARALVSWLDDKVFSCKSPSTVRESAVGGGAWLEAAMGVWPDATLTAIDLDPLAPGLQLAHQQIVGDFHQVELRRVDLDLGNPAYAGDLVAWIDRARQHARVVAYLLRGTFLGGQERLPWYQARPPSDVVMVPRPKWEGPGARPTTDKVDSVFVVWVEGYSGPTRLHWLDVREEQ